MRAGILYVGLVLNACAQDPTAVLAHARDKILDLMDRLPNYTCLQTLDRKYYERSSDPHRRRSCDELIGERRKGSYKLELQGTDRLRVDVKVSEGQEIAAWAAASRFDSRSIIDIVGDGPLGTGPFGTMVAEIFSSPDVQFQYLGESSLQGVNVLEYRYEVPVSTSRYFIRAGNEWVPMAYDGTFSIDPAAFLLRRLKVQASGMPAKSQSCEATTMVDYQLMRVGAGDFLVPQTSVLHFLMADSSETESTATYTACHEYRGESTIHFEDVPINTAAAEKAPVREPLSIPAGLTIHLALETPIDSDTAAAGDVVTAKVLKTARSHDVSIPAGTTVRGRIAVMRHRFVSPAMFEIGILFQSLNVGGVDSPFYARLFQGAASPNIRRFQRREESIHLPARGQSSEVGMLYFETAKGRHVVPQGYKFDWITISPPEPKR